MGQTMVLLKSISGITYFDFDYFAPTAWVGKRFRADPEFSREGREGNERILRQDEQDEVFWKRLGASERPILIILSKNFSIQTGNFYLKCRA
jgi:hypothetical protein